MLVWEKQWISCRVELGGLAGVLIFDDILGDVPSAVITAELYLGKDCCNLVELELCLSGLHPRSKKSHVYIFTVVCPLSMWCECIPLRNKKAVTDAHALVEQVFCRYGTPLALLSDRGGEVDGHIMREVCRLLQIDKLHTSSYHTACNSACERTLNSLLGKVVSSRQTD